MDLNLPARERSAQHWPVSSGFCAVHPWEVSLGGIYLPVAGPLSFWQLAHAGGYVDNPPLGGLLSMQAR